MALRVQIDEVSSDASRDGESVRVSVFDDDQKVADLQVWRDGRQELLHGSLEGVGLVEWSLPE